MNNSECRIQQDLDLGITMVRRSRRRHRLSVLWFPAVFLVHLAFVGNVHLDFWSGFVPLHVLFVLSWFYIAVIRYQLKNEVRDSCRYLLRTVLVARNQTFISGQLTTRVEEAAKVLGIHDQESISQD